MSLLTDKEILVALNGGYQEAWGNDAADLITDVECGDRALADASQAATLKAVAEWLTENRHVDNCGNWYVYLTFKNSQKDRQEITWFKRLRKGLM